MNDKQRQVKKVKQGYWYWVKKVDKVFSEYIRLRDSVNGKCQCITCGNIFEVSKIDAGHYRPRQHMATRYDERNVHPQCKRCNNFEGGEQHIHGEEIDNLYGQGTARELLEKSHTIRKYTIPELKDLFEYYQERVSKIASA